MFAVKPAGMLTQAESLALWALRKPGGISRSHSPAAKPRSHFTFFNLSAFPPFRHLPSTIFRLPFPLSNGEWMRESRKLSEVCV